MAGVGKPDMEIRAFKKALEIDPHSTYAAGKLQKNENFLKLKASDPD